MPPDGPEPCPECTAGRPVCPGPCGRRSHTHTDQPLCPSCRRQILDALTDLPELYVHLYLALPGAQTATERVSGTREPPVPPDMTVEALMRDIIATVTTWVEPVAEQAGITGTGRPRRLAPDVRLRNTWVTRTETVLDADGQPARDDYGDPVAVTHVERAATVAVVSQPDSTSGVALSTACRVLAAHLDVLLALPATDVMEWDDTAGPDGSWQPVDRDGVDAAFSILSLHDQARANLGHTRGSDHLKGVACPERSCSQKLLYRDHGSDVVVCKACRGQWPRDELVRWTKMLAGQIVQRKGRAVGRASA